MAEVIKVAGREEFDKLGAERLDKAIHGILTQQKSLVLGIPGGRSVAGIFQQMLYRKIPWKKIHIFMVDERQVHLKDKESNYKLARDTFITQLIDDDKIHLNNIHPYRLNDGIKIYQKELEEYGGRYDIILLSSGEDGHIGAIYPNHHSFDDESEYYIKMDDSPKPPPERISMSRKMLLKSQCAMLLFLGEGKRQAYERFHDMNVSFRECPAKLVWQIPDSVILTDLQ